MEKVTFEGIFQDITGGREFTLDQTQILDLPSTQRTQDKPTLREPEVKDVEEVRRKGPSYSPQKRLRLALCLTIASKLMIACSGEVKPEVTPTRQFGSVTSICLMPDSPQEFLNTIPLPETYDLTQVEIQNGVSIEIRNYSKDEIEIDTSSMAKVYKLFQVIDYSKDIISHGGDISSQETSPIIDGTIIVIHDGVGSEQMGCTPNSFALTANARQGSSEPDVSEVSLQTLKQAANGKSTFALTYSTVTEVCQQYSYSKTDTKFDESVCNGYGYLVAFIQDTLESGEDSGTLYAQYAQAVSELRTTYSLTGEELPFALFHPDFFEKVRNTINQQIIEWR